MTWIVNGERNGMIELISKGSVDGMLPKGSYLTVEEGDSRFILRVDNTKQNDPYSPSSMLIDMDLGTMIQDRKSQNIISAFRVKTISNREDGLIDYIRPQSIARRSNQSEINDALGTEKYGPRVFLSTIYAGQNQLLRDESNTLLTATLPIDMFYHQMLICGKTGSGKTVAMKYLAQYFVEELGGCVLAINVKEADFLRMDKESNSDNSNIIKEWEDLKMSPHPISSFIVYYPANSDISDKTGVNPEISKRITLKVEEIDPDSLSGLIQGITDSAAQSLPNIFRWWLERKKESNEEITFNGFINYFQNAINDKLFFNTMNIRGEEGSIKLHRATYDSIMKKFDAISYFFDNENAISLNESDILIKGQMSVIDVASKNGITFGSILLRNLLNKIVTAKARKEYNIPVLIIIDEVHMFYNSNASSEALGDLDTICRTGRSMKIGVIFASQNPSDIPRGLSSVINTKIFFKSDAPQVKTLGVNVTPQEMESLGKGYAIGSIHDLSQLKYFRFPLSLSGVFDKED